MKRINRAVQKQSIHKLHSSDPLYSSQTKTGLCVSDQFFEEQGRKSVISLLSKYIVFQDVNNHYWIDRYWYFDLEKYEKDLQAFGIDFAKAIYSEISPDGIQS